jgi:hypothetical protein
LCAVLRGAADLEGDYMKGPAIVAILADAQKIPADTAGVSR